MIKLARSPRSFRKGRQMGSDVVTNRKTNGWRILALLVLIATVIMPSVLRAADDPLLMGVFPRRNAAETAKAFTPMANSSWRTPRPESEADHYQEFRILLESKRPTTIRHRALQPISLHPAQRRPTRSSRTSRNRQKHHRSCAIPRAQGQRHNFFVATGRAHNYVRRWRRRDDQLYRDSLSISATGLKKDDFKSLFAINPPLARRPYPGRAARAGDGDRICRR